MCEPKDPVNSNTDAAAPNARKLPCPPFPCPDGLRLFSFSPGEAHGIAFREGIRIRKESRGPGAVEEKGIERLEQLGMVNRWEAGLLRDVVALAAKEGDLRDTYRAVLAIHQKLLDAGGGGVALTITGIAVDSLTGQMTASDGGAQSRKWWGKDVEGAIGGAGVGATLGGPGGAILGGIIGGVALSIAAAVE